MKVPVPAAAPALTVKTQVFAVRVTEDSVAETLVASPHETE